MEHAPHAAGVHSTCLPLLLEVQVVQPGSQHEGLGVQGGWSRIGVCGCLGQCGEVWAAVGTHEVGGMRWRSAWL